MKTIENYTRRSLLIIALLCGVMAAIAQPRPSVNTDRKEFDQLLKEANLDFKFPAGFRQIKAVNNEDFSFDFAMDVPGKNFEMWLQVKSQKQNWTSYEKAQNDKKTELANPDSMYIGMSKATAAALTGSDPNEARNISVDVLSRYNADAGKSYLLNLLDLPVTKHYKYALIITLQKNHTGTLTVVYFTNDKDTDFYKYVYRAGHCIKFKPQLPG